MALRKLKDLRGENAVAAEAVIDRAAKDILPALSTLVGRNAALAESLAQTEADLEAERAAHTADNEKAARAYDKLKARHDASVEEMDALKHAIGRTISKPLKSTGKSALDDSDD